MAARTGMMRAVPEYEQRGEERKADACRRAAFERLWTRERPRVWRLTARICGCADAADDLTQEVGLRALSAYGGFRGASSEATWLYRIAVNTAIRWRQQQARHTQGRNSLDAVPEIAGPPEASPERQAIRADDHARMHGALDTLPEDLRTLLLLHAWEGMKYREIAALLEIPVGTVMSRLNAARTRLRRYLDTEGGGDAL
jgi:RNA polymerase sigma-70 factor, ECF subfamily